MDNDGLPNGRRSRSVTNDLAEDGVCQLVILSPNGTDERVETQSDESDEDSVETQSDESDEDSVETQSDSDDDIIHSPSEAIKKDKSYYEEVARRWKLLPRKSTGPCISKSIQQRQSEENGEDEDEEEEEEEEDEEEEEEEEEEEVHFPAMLKFYQGTYEPEEEEYEEEYEEVVEKEEEPAPPPPTIRPRYPLKRCQMLPKGYRQVTTATRYFALSRFEKVPDRLQKKMKLKGYLDTDARLTLQHKLKSNFRQRATREVICRLVGPIQIRATQEMWVNIAANNAPQMCQTTILISGDVEEENIEEEIRNAYFNGATVLDEWKEGDLEDEVFLLQSFVSENVVILRRNVIVEATYVWRASTRSSKHKVCDVRLVDYKGCGSLFTPLEIYCSPVTEKDADVFSLRACFSFVFSKLFEEGQLVRVNWIVDAFDEDDDRKEFQMDIKAKAVDAYVTVTHKFSVPNRSEEFGILGDFRTMEYPQYVNRQIKMLLHDFRTDQWFDDNVLYHLTTVETAVDEPFRVKRKRRGEDVHMSASVKKRKDH